MTKNIFKVIEENGELSIYHQSGGQFCNARRYYGWRAKFLNFIINYGFFRK